MDIVSDKKVKTRKSHKCWGCTEDIPIGSTVLLITSVDDGQIASVYWCNVCEGFLNTLNSYDKQDGFLFGELSEYEDYPFKEAQHD